VTERILVEGEASGRLLVLEEPLSFWGGFDPTTGSIVDRRHPQAGVSLAGVVLAMPFGRGSSSGSSGIVESARLGTGPVGFVLREPDEIVAVGAIVVGELYGRSMPVVVADEQTYGALRTGQVATITPSGEVRVEVDGRHTS